MPLTIRLPWQTSSETTFVVCPGGRACATVGMQAMKGSLQTAFISDALQHLLQTSASAGDEHGARMAIARCFGPVLKSLSRQASPRGDGTLSLVDNFLTPLCAMQSLLACPAIASVAVRHPLFPSPLVTQHQSTGARSHWHVESALPDRPAGSAGVGSEPRLISGLQHASLLGVFFQPSVLPDVGRPLGDAALRQAFDAVIKPGGRVVSTDLDAAQASIRNSMRLLEGRLLQIVRDLIKVDRVRTMFWLGALVEVNAGKAKMADIPGTSCSDGFAFNLCVVLVRLASNPKLQPDRVEADWVLAPSIGLGNEARIIATDADLTEWNDSSHPARWSFVTECLFLAARSVQLGYTTLVAKKAGAFQNVSDATKQRQKLIDYRDANGLAMSRSELANIEGDIAKWESLLKARLSEVLAYETVVCDPGVCADLLELFRKVAQVLLRLCGATPERPWACEPLPRALLAMPCFLLETMADTLKEASRIDGAVIVPEEIVLLLTIFLGSKSLLSNPYLRGKLCEALFLHVPVGSQARKSFPQDLLRPDSKVTHELAAALLRLYVDIDYTTERTNEFYSKFFTRFLIMQLVEYLWAHPGCQERIKRLAEENAGSLMLQLVNIMLNDANYLVEEVLAKIPLLKELEKKLFQMQVELHAGPELAEVEANIAEFTGTVAHYNRLLLALLPVMLKFCEDAQLSDHFLRSEMCPRVALVLNHLLKALTGPKCTMLKVSDPEKYVFQPRDLLRNIAKMYCALAPSPSFAAAVASDGMSYDTNLFAKAIRIIRRENLLDPPSQLVFERFSDEARQHAASAQRSDEDLGEAPDEFLDPIMCHIMEDPVLLTTSNKIVDRCTIERHLLSDSTDPFMSKTHLDLSMVQPMPELRARICEWRQSRTQAATQGHDDAFPLKANAMPHAPFRFQTFISLVAWVLQVVAINVSAPEATLLVRAGPESCRPHLALASFGS